ncbi:M48 family metallopeptidase [Fictibacillus sp. BK138]|uniref:M48 family metallopeptidase n=1 Tax=Fictibacillus sp. BK138 TaxID=2512121 RepID=UPI001029B5AB|nr:SprT family zinc-dependent metalloprotease [Fictibacillus sp. BK138]RZT23602.1 hypothetical protein EV282_2695 [Fictibacillus sp. BK138]
MHQIRIGNLEIDVFRKDIKNLHLAVYPPNGRVRIAAPLKSNEESIRLFAVSKITWIKNQQKKFHEQVRQSEREYVSGESHYVYGTRYLLTVIPDSPKNHVNIRNKTYLDLYVKKGSTKEQREKVITEWYRKQLKSEIPQIIEKWQDIMCVEVKDWGVKKMRTKWGSCNIENQRIWINLDLAKKPKHCLEYVIVHEMVHLLERNHNDQFVAYMDRFLPQWRIIKNELNKLIFY